MISFKDVIKTIGIIAMTLCAVLISTLFLNYMIDLRDISNLITTSEMQTFYDAQLMTSKVVVGVTGGCLLLTTIVTLFFYIKIYIDNHKSELGILKALGYSNFLISKRFSIFGLSVFIGTSLGYIMALLMMNYYYEVQLEDGFLPVFKPTYNIELFIYLVIIPTIIFGVLSMIYANRKLKTPALDLIKGSEKIKIKKIKSDEDKSFLKQLKISTFKQKKSLIFFIGFSVFCFANLIQMGFSMNDLSSPLMKWMMYIIGIVLSAVTMLLAMNTLIKNQKKNIGMMRVFGYQMKECRKYILDSYKIVSYIGFALGTIYQYFLLKIMVEIVFKDIEVPEYSFNFKLFLITLGIFIIVYELLIRYYSRKLNKIPIKEIMLDSI